MIIQEETIPHITMAIIIMTMTTEIITLMSIMMVNTMTNTSTTKNLSASRNHCRVVTSNHYHIYPNITTTQTLLLSITYADSLSLSACKTWRMLVIMLNAFVTSCIHSFDKKISYFKLIILFINHIILQLELFGTS